MDPLVTVIILNWNNAADTLRCLRSVFACDYPNYQVIVVDNGSRDGSVAVLRQAYPDLTILENGQNLGYTGANNAGIVKALGQGADYIFLLNDDAILAPDTLSWLMTAARSYPQAGFFGPKIFAIEESNRLLSAGGLFDPKWKPRHRGMGELDQGQFNQPTAVDYLSGCALLVSRKAIETVGMLAPQFFAYCEDLEWCYRGKKRGIMALFIPEAKVWHPDTRRRDDDSVMVTYYSARNMLLFARESNLGLMTFNYILLSDLRTLFSWSLCSRWKNKKRQRDALICALLDFARGRFGKAEGLL